MPIPALIVGLGGTGTLAATYVKKELLENSEAWPIREVRILAFDTDKGAAQQYAVGGKGQFRKAGQTTGAVSLGAGEFFFIGGNVKTWMEEIAAGKHPHLRTWLQARTYLNTLPDQTYNLNEGAGQFRQFGRLAVFKDVSAPNNSVIYNTLRDAMERLKQNNPTMAGLKVFLVSSLAGGTGAGMFADIAHLIRQIAKQPNVDLAEKMTLRGYLVLPDAFSRDVPPSFLTSMYSRSYAAMRENRRFTVSFDYERGYPMRYHEGTGDLMWHGAVKGKLFDLIYYIDGQSDSGAVSLVNSVTPAIADTISAAIDKESGPLFSSHVANVEAERNHRIQRREISGKTATYGSVGTYSIVFPIFHIVEGWAHDLGLEVLNTLLAPKEFDSRSGIPVVLSGNSNQENQTESGDIAGVKFLQAFSPVSYQYRDENGNMKTSTVEPTLLFGELARIALETKRAHSGIAQTLVGRHILDWNQSFIPNGTDRETMLLLQRVENAVRVKIYDPAGVDGEIKASDQSKPKEDPQTGSVRILDEARVFKNRHLGTEDARTGQRSGGLYRNTLAQIVEYHMERFTRCLDLEIQSIMNGSPNRLASESKGGKLGYLSDFINSLYSTLSLAGDTLRGVQKQRREQGQQRRNAIASAHAAGQTMQTNAGKKDFLKHPAAEAYSAQHSYLAAEASLVDILQVEAMEEAILDATMRMADYVLSARQEVEAWENTLARHAEGLYARLLRGRKLIDSDRIAGKDVLVRLIIDDPDYEGRRYIEYVNAIRDGWTNRILGDIHWTLDHHKVAGQLKVNLGITIQTGDSNGRTVKVDTWDDNLSLWLEMCRRPFSSARQTESIIGYLMQHRDYRDPIYLAGMIHKNSGVQLNFEGGNPLPANYLRAYFQTEEQAGHQAYLRNVVQQLAQISGRSAIAPQAGTTNAENQSEPGGSPQSKGASFASSEDRFKLTLVYTQELIELDRIKSYSITGHSAYLGSQDQVTRGDRRLLHVFPAEVHSAEYEDRLPELNQDVRLFSDDVTLQLEDDQRLRLFLLCYVYGLAERAGLKDSSGNQCNFWRLSLPPARPYDDLGNPAQPDEYWLTDPKLSPYILNALLTFNFVGLDTFGFEGKDAKGHSVRRGTDYVRSIDYSQVSQALARARQADAQARLQAGTAGQFSLDLKERLTDIDEAAQAEILPDLARLDRIREMQAHLENVVIPNYAKALGNPDNQKDYDIASVFALMLRDEVKEMRRAIKDRLDAVRGTGGQFKPPEVTDDTDRIDLF